ncbi:MFS transporter [Chloroflexota bacterium]
MQSIVSGGVRLPDEITNLTCGILDESMSHEKERYGLATVKFFYGWIITVCCTFITLINGGIFFTFGVFFKPVAIDFVWSRGEIASNYTAMLVAYAPGALFAGWLADRRGPRGVLLLAAVLIGLGFFGCAQANNLAIMITSYTVIGFGLGATLAIPTATIQRWFIRLRAPMVGVVYAGNSVGGLIFAPLANYLIMLNGWRIAYRIIGIIFFGVVAIAASFIVSNPSAKKLKPFGYEEKVLVSSYPSQSMSIPAFGLSQNFRNSTFWCITTLHILTFMPAFFINSHLVSYITDKGISATIGAQGLGLMVGISIIGRLFMSWIAGKIGWMKALTVCYFFASVSIVWLMFVAGTESFYLFVIIYGLSWGSTLALLGGSVGSFFGLSVLSELQGFFLGFGVLIAAFTPWLGGFIYDLTASYSIAMYIAAVLYAVAGLISLLLKPTILEGN